MIDLIKNFVFTEKSIDLVVNRKYMFDVDVRLTKPKIKKLIEKLFQVKVLSVNTHRPPRKKRRLGQSQGYRSSYKRAIVTLKPNNVIKITSEN